MRNLLWHGYLLGGTGSNVYTRSVAREWSRAGDDVVVVCQEPNPELYDLGGARVVRRTSVGYSRSSSSTATRGREAKLLQHGSELEYSMRGNQELSDWGGRRWPTRALSSSARCTSVRCWRTWSGTSTAVRGSSGRGRRRVSPRTA